MTEEAVSSESRAMRDLLGELEPVLGERSIRHGEFTLSSGARSHYYCDAKLTLLSPRGARLCGEALFRLLRPFGVEAVGGPAMGAAYMAAAVAMASSGTGSPLYGFTVRRATKDHGRNQSIDESWHPDGALIRPGRRVAVVDDVVTTAGSLLDALDAVKAAGCEIAVVAAILDRQAGGAERIRERGYPFHSLFAADEEGRLSQAQLPPGVD